MVVFQQTLISTQPAFTYSKITMETQKQYMKSVKVNKRHQNGATDVVDHISHCSVLIDDFEQVNAGQELIQSHGYYHIGTCQSNSSN